MKTIIRILGVLCVIAGTIPPYLMYAKSEDGNLRNPALFATILVAASISLAVFGVCRLLFTTALKRLFIGAIASYVALLLFLLVAARITGDLAETTMWMPIILLFGIPFMAPLVGMSWLGSILIFGKRNNETEPSTAPYSEPAARSPQG